MEPSLESLASRVAGRILTDPLETAPFLTDWRGLWRGRAIGVAQPATPADVVEIVRWCAAHGVPVVPQGGNTGMSGGATPDQSGSTLVLSLARMTRVRAVDDINDTITVDAGCLLETVQTTASAAGRFFPLSLAAEGSCTIGGNLATNAGGTGVLRYGNMRDLCLGIEVVTAKGELWDGLRGLRKDNTGYDLRDLYIGSEGTLGVITGAVLKLFPKPVARVTAIVAVETIPQALTVLEMARSRFDAAVTGFELMSDACIALVVDHIPDTRRPVETQTPWYALIELSDFHSENDARVRMESLLGDALEAEIVLDGAIASSIAQSKAFWALRESIAEAQGAIGKTIKHDISLPLSKLAAFVSAAHDEIQALYPNIRFVTFGHLGDGNLHYNFSPAPGEDPGDFLNAQEPLNRLVHDRVVAAGGSISAEHGLGVLRRDEAARFKSPVEMDLMRALKAAFDPTGLMNPGKLLA